MICILLHEITQQIKLTHFEANFRESDSTEEPGSQALKLLQFSLFAH